MSYSVNIPDFAGSLARGEQMQASRLQMMAQQQALDDAQKYSAVARDVLPQLGTAEGPARLSLLSRLAGSGPQGAQMALPMLTQERQAAEFQRMLSGAMGGAAPAPAAPAAAPAVLPAPAGGARGEAPAAVTAGIDARRALDPNSPTYAQDIMRINDGVVARTMPGGRPVAPAAAAPAPAAAPASTNGLPSPQALFAMAASGNPRAIEFVRTVGPLVARENPNFQTANVGGRVIAFNPQNPNAPRIDLGPSETAQGQEQRPYGGSASGASLAFIEQHAQAVAAGTASPEVVRRYLSAVTEYQQERVSADGTRVVPRLPAYAPGADVVVQRYPSIAPQAAAPAPAAPAQAAAPGGVPIGQTGMVAQPPPLQPSPLPTAQGGVARPDPQPSNTDRTRLRTMEVEAQSLRDALATFRSARANATPGERAMAAAGMPTPLSTAWSNAALLAKGEVLYNLGVLNGADLTIIQRTLSDPATLRGLMTGQQTTDAQIRQIETLIEQRLETARVQYGGQAPRDRPAADGGGWAIRPVQ